MKLVIAEKPSVAKSIANVLGADERQDGYLEGNGYLVSWCYGHLIELAQPGSYGEAYKKWNYESLPILPSPWKYEIKPDTKEQYDILEELMHDDRVESVVCATDAGREGELIFRLVYDMADCDKPIERLWISSMEESAIQKGFEDLRPGREYDNLYNSALCRQEADWLVGINGTRLFTVLYGGKVLKMGRVQTPTLAMVVERENQIANFVKEKYYTSHILIESMGIDAGTERIDKESAARKIAEDCKGKTATVVSVEKEEKKVQPPKLYDLTTLQRDANRLLGLTAKQTLEYTQNLYEKRLVTYPRTDSQYLSDDMEETAKSVIVAIKEHLTKAWFKPDTTEDYLDVKRVMDSKKVTDHHAIIPTVEIAKTDLAALPDGEHCILLLIAGRLLCGTGKVHVYETVQAQLECNGITFTTMGNSIVDMGWKKIENTMKTVLGEDGKPKEKEEKKLPEMSEGMVFENVDSEVKEHFTRAPKHYTEDSLLAAMERAGNDDMNDEVERKGLGTPATRADIIEKLVQDGFVNRDKKQLLPTQNGMNLIKVLPEEVKSPKLTADWENTLTLVAKGEYSMAEFMHGIEKMVSDLVSEHSSVSEEEKQLFSSNEVIGICPKCKGEIVKGKFGIYCKNKCGMNVGKIMGQPLTEEQVKRLLAGKKVLLKGLKSKNGKKYDAYFIPDGIEQYSYMNKEQQPVTGYQFKFNMEFPKKKIKKF